jgi:SAM-dependent methyltransferase
MTEGLKGGARIREVNMKRIKKVFVFVMEHLKGLKQIIEKRFRPWLRQQMFLLRKKSYSLEDARNYWRYPPSKAYGKKDTADYCTQSDDFIKDLIEREIKIRDVRQGTQVFKDKVAFWAKENHIRTMMDFGCGLGQDGLYFAKTLGVQVVFGDIVPSNVKLTSRFANIWGISTESVLIDDPKTFDVGRKFDLIFSNGVLHHSPEARDIVRNLKRFLTPHGLFIVMLYTRKHYERAGARDIHDYAVKSEASAPIPVSNPYTEYYDLEKAQKLFEGCIILDQWTTYDDLFGWYCFRIK